MKQANSSKWSKFTLNLPPNIAHGQKYSIKLSLLKDDKGVSVESITKVDTVDTEISAVGLCSVCWERPRNCVFLPCGHIQCCFDCGVNIYVHGKGCPVCRKFIRMRPHKVYQWLGLAGSFHGRHVTKLESWIT